MKLYIYDHCPYCLKARMIFGLKNIPVELHVLLNDDAETPTRMVGQKQVPILQKDDSRYMPESMDIVHYVDKLDGKPLLTGKRSPAIEEWLRKVNGLSPGNDSDFNIRGERTTNAITVTNIERFQLFAIIAHINQAI